MSIKNSPLSDVLDPSTLRLSERDAKAFGLTWISVRQTAELLGVSQASIWRWAKTQPSFPKPVQLSAGCTRIRLSDLEAYLEQLRSRQ